MNKIKLAIIIGQLFLLILQFINFKSMKYIWHENLSESIIYAFKYILNYILSIIIIILMVICLAI